LALLASTTVQALPSVSTHQVVPFLETTSPEFSQLLASSGELPNYTNSESLNPFLIPSAAQQVPEVLKNLEALPKLQSGVSSPTSGTQLYYQRLVALKAGKIYTRLPADSFQSLWTKETGKGELLLQKPTHEQWIRLLAQEAKAIATGQGDNRLGILVGDSLSMWFPTEGLPGGQLWLNQGISGENSSQILNRLSAFSQTRPDTIYVMAGTNDLRQGVSDEVILNNLQQIVSRLRLNHPQAQVVVESILPMRLSAIPNQRIRNLNQQIAAIAQQQGAGYLNLNALFADSEGQMRPELTTDGIHLTRRGYELWQDAIHYAESVMAVNRVARQ
jgi:lysophospholipase L1-like esterase